MERLKQRNAEYNRASRELFELERQGRVFVIAPEDTYGVKLTEGNWGRLEPLYREGIAGSKEKNEGAESLSGGQMSLQLLYMRASSGRTF